MSSRFSTPRKRSRRMYRWRVAVITFAAGLLAITPPLRGDGQDETTTAPAAAPAEAAAPVRPVGKKAAIVPIRDTIDDIQWKSIERRVDHARDEGADTIIFELHTPGGLVTSALEISKYIKSLPEQGVYTVAWVNTQAYSAGAMIAVAAQQIVVASTASIGDCAPIMVTPVGGIEELGEVERAKIESPILQEFRDSAVRNDYDPVLLRAMVAVGAEVWWIEETESGRRRFVEGAEKTKLIDDVPQEERLWRLAATYVHPAKNSEVPVEQPIVRGNALLTLGADQAMAFGLATGIASTPEAVRSLLGLAQAPPVYKISGWEAFAMWLNSPLVRGVLFILVIIGAYIEFQSPGLILPGATALVALAIFLAAPYAAGLATTWTILVLVIGLILLAVELFLLPGFGIAGVLGALLVLAAFIGTFVPAEPGAPPFSWPNLQGTWEALKTGVLVMSTSMIIAVIGIFLLARYLPSVPGANTMFLRPTAPVETLAISDPAPHTALVGEIGVVTGALRPGGQARFGQEIVDVTSQGEYVDSGRRVQVLRHTGNKIVVRPLPDDGPDGPLA